MTRIMEKKFISWRRVSTLAQKKSNLGLEAQKYIIEYFVKYENGILIADYEECHTGTSLSGCIELRKAMEHCKKENACLIIAKVDRFRTVIEALQILDYMGEKNIMFCDLPSTDRFNLTLYTALAEREALLVSIRTKQALQAKKARGEKLGAASENYSVDKVIQEQGRIKASKSRNDRTIHDPEFLSFCRILKRTSKVLQGSSGSLQGSSDLFMLDWINYKADIFKSLTRADLLNVIDQMRNAKADNRDLFKSYTLDNSERQISLIRSKINNTFRIIETYNKNNKIGG